MNPQEDFFNWLEERFELNSADKSLIAQFLHDVKKETIFQNKFEENKYCDCESKSSDLFGKCFACKKQIKF